MANKDNPFRVPENYFNELEEEILKKVNQIPKKRFFFTEYKSVLKYAALVLLLLGISGLLWWNLPSKNSNLKQEYVELKTNKSTPSQLESELIAEQKAANPAAQNQSTTDITSNQETSIVKTKNLEQDNNEFFLSEEELEYLENYLQDDIINDYLTYNEVEL